MKYFLSLYVYIWINEYFVKKMKFVCNKIKYYRIKVVIVFCWNVNLFIVWKLLELKFGNFNYK